jgi:hypothetical protein
VTRTLGLGLAGAGRFGAVLAAAVTDLLGLQLQTVGDRLQLQAGQVGDRRGEERAEPAGAGQAKSEGACHVWSSRATPILESAMP